MGLSAPDVLASVLDVLHPYAVIDVAEAIARGQLDPDDRRAVLDRAIEAHAQYTGLTLEIKF